MPFHASPYEARSNLEKVLGEVMAACGVPEDDQSHLSAQLTEAVDSLVSERVLDLENKIRERGEWSRDY